MDISTIEFIPVTLRLKEPSVVAYEELESVDNLVVKMTGSNGKTGWGNAAPDVHVTGEDFETISTLAESGTLQEDLEGNDVFLISRLEALLLEELAGLPALRAGISTAAWDLMARSMKVPLWQLLGRARSTIPTSITLSLLPPGKVREMAKYYREQGFEHPKLKLGGTLEEDMERIRIVHELFGKETPLRLDANQSYSAESALQLLDTLHKEEIPVAFLEQPTPAHHLHSLSQVTTLSPGIKIMADESALNCRDVMLLGEHQAADLVNVKMMKCGGIEPARRCNYVAQCARIPAMMGCMDESRISIAAALAVCLSNANFVYADLDGHVEIENDPARGGVTLEDGVLHLSDEPGLGVNVTI